MTVVRWYSSDVLKEVMTQETIGRIAMNEQKITEKYLTINHAIDPGVYFFFVMITLLSLIRLCVLFSEAFHPSPHCGTGI